MWIGGMKGSVTPAVSFVAAVLQAGGFVMWYHDYIGVESLVVRALFD